MPPKNLWYLITSDEIDAIRKSLQDMAGAVPFIGRNRTREVIQHPDTVRDRRP